MRQSSTVVIVKEELYEPSIANTSKVAPKSVLIGVLTVNVRADWLWIIQEGIVTLVPFFLTDMAVAAVKHDEQASVAYLIA